MSLTGQCQCGHIHYEVQGDPLAVYICHCTECQKQSASAFGMSLRVQRADLVVTKGTPAAWDCLADSGRKKTHEFCANCGTRLFHHSRGDDRAGNIVSVKPGTLDDRSWYQPVAHLWTKSKQPWVEIPNNTLVYEGQPEDFSAIYARWQEIIADK